MSNITPNVRQRRPVPIRTYFGWQTPGDVLLSDKIVSKLKKELLLFQYCFSSLSTPCFRNDDKYPAHDRVPSQIFVQLSSGTTSYYRVVRRQFGLFRQTCKCHKWRPGRSRVGFRVKGQTKDGSWVVGIGLVLVDRISILKFYVLKSIYEQGTF